MPRVQIHVPAGLYEQMKAHGVRPSAMFQAALREELRRQELLKETDRYLDELRSEVGDPTPQDIAWADRIVSEIKEHVRQSED